MAERTISLRAEQVRAIRAGATQVRVPIKLVPATCPVCHGDGRCSRSNGCCTYCDGDGKISSQMVPPKKCPYAPGDVLRVREPWRAKSWTTNAKFDVCIEYAAGGEHRCSHDDVERFLDSCMREWETSSPDAEVLRWRSAATMPAWAARMWLAVERVQAERDSDGWAWALTVRETEGKRS